VQDNVDKGDDRLKERLKEILKDFGNIKYHELKAMMRFKQIQNEVTHKGKWKPNIQNRKQRNETRERIKVATKNHADQENLNSLLEKCIKNVYI
jgi:hypothetical protein